MTFLDFIKFEIHFFFTLSLALFVYVIEEELLRAKKHDANCMVISGCLLVNWTSGIFANKVKTFTIRSRDYTISGNPLTKGRRCVFDLTQ